MCSLTSDDGLTDHMPSLTHSCALQGSGCAALAQRSVASHVHCSSAVVFSRTKVVNPLESDLPAFSYRT